MPKPLAFLLIVGVGAAAYLLGAKAGTSRYREISGAARHVWDDPAVKKVRKRAHKALEKAGKKAARRLG